MKIESINAVEAVQRTPEALPISRQNVPGEQRIAVSQNSTDISQTAQRDIEKSLQALNEAIKSSDISLEFNRDEESGKMVIQMIDQKTGQTVQQFPSEATIHLSVVLGKLQGLVFNHKA